MEDEGINHWVTPPESPDMNPIENVWAGLKHYVRKVKKPRNKEQLVEGINEYWATITPELCNRYINHLYKVIPEVIRLNGQASGY
jgi:transposase